MHLVTITAKRQATLPAALCKELGLAPGTKVSVERRLVGKKTVWILKGPGPDWSWIGSLRRYARGRSHRLRDIQRSLGGTTATFDRTQARLEGGVLLRP